MSYRKANIIKAIFCFLFNKSKYISIATSHNMAINLEAKDLKKLYDEGKYPTEESLKNTEISVIDSANILQKKIIKSFFWILLILVIMLIVGYFADTIHPYLSFNFGYVLSVIGALLILWGSLISLGPELETYKGKTLHEIFFSAFRSALFILGTLCLIIVVAI